MIRVGRLFVVAAWSVVAIVLVSPLLFWLGRTNVQKPYTVDELDLLKDDAGVDVDEVTYS